MLAGGGEMSRGALVGRLSVGLLLVALVGCTRKPGDAAYFPLDRGRTWTYSVTPEAADETDEPLTMTVTSLGPEDVAGAHVVKEKIDLASDSHYLFAGADQKGVFRHATQAPGEKQPTVEPQPDYFVVFPLAVGRTWQSKGAPTFLD